MFKDLDSQLQIMPEYNDHSMENNLMQDHSEEKMLFGKLEKTNGGPEKDEEEKKIAITIPPKKRGRGRPRKFKENMLFDKLDKKNCGHEKDEEEKKTAINQGPKKRGRKKKKKERR